MNLIDNLSERGRKALSQFEGSVVIVDVGNSSLSEAKQKVLCQDFIAHYVGYFYKYLRRYDANHNLLSVYDVLVASPSEKHPAALLEFVRPYAERSDRFSFLYKKQFERSFSEVIVHPESDINPVKYVDGDIVHVESERSFFSRSPIVW